MQFIKPYFEGAFRLPALLLCLYLTQSLARPYAVRRAGHAEGRTDSGRRIVKHHLKTVHSAICSSGEKPRNSSTRTTRRSHHSCHLHDSYRSYQKTWKLVAWVVGLGSSRRRRTARTSQALIELTADVVVRSSLVPRRCPAISCARPPWRVE